MEKISLLFFEEEGDWLNQNLTGLSVPQLQSPHPQNRQLNLKVPKMSTNEKGKPIGRNKQFGSGVG